VKGPYGSSLTERLVATAAAILFAAVALTIAVHLFEQIWPVLLAVTLGIGAIVAAFVFYRQRFRDW
jgi:uncharacterized membrane protein YfcA